MCVFMIFYYIIQCGRSFLHACIQYGRTDVCRFLISIGVNIDQVDEVSIVFHEVYNRCHSHDAHQRHRAGCKFTRNAYTNKRFIIRPQLNNNLPTSVIQLTHKRATIVFNQKIIKHSFQ